MLRLTGLFLSSGRLLFRRWSFGRSGPSRRAGSPRRRGSSGWAGPSRRRGSLGLVVPSSGWAGSSRRRGPSRRRLELQRLLVVWLGQGGGRRDDDDRHLAGQVAAVGESAALIDRRPSLLASVVVEAKLLLVRVRRTMRRQAVDRTAAAHRDEPSGKRQASVFQSLECGPPVVGRCVQWCVVGLSETEQLQSEERSHPGGFDPPVPPASESMGGLGRRSRRRPVVVRAAANWAGRNGSGEWALMQSPGRSVSEGRDTHRGGGHQAPTRKGRNDRRGRTQVERDTTCIQLV